MDSASLSIAVLFSPKPHQEKQLMDAASGAQLFFLSPESVNADRLADMDIILGNPPPSLLRDCCHLRLLQLQSAGADAYLPAGILPAGTILCNAAGAYGLSLSEYMMAILLELFRKTHLYRDNQRKGIWKNEGPVRSIWNSTVLIVGLGDIGREFSRRLKAFGATVVGVRRRKLPKPDWLDEMYQIEALDSLLPRADVVALCLPATPETAGLMDRRRLSLMKQGAVLLNVGRGSAVDTDALVEALQSGHLYGAGLDVTDPEPLPEGHPLWQCSNLVLTPHIAGGLDLSETQDRMVNIAAGNIARLIRGEPLQNVVDLTAGY